MDKFGSCVVKDADKIYIEEECFQVENNKLRKEELMNHVA